MAIAEADLTEDSPEDGIKRKGDESPAVDGCLRFLCLLIVALGSFQLTVWAE
jgi:hypothetical protein